MEYVEATGEYLPTDFESNEPIDFTKKIVWGQNPVGSGAMCTVNGKQITLYTLLHQRFYYWDIEKQKWFKPKTDVSVNSMEDA